MTEIWNTFLVHPLINLLVGAYGLLADFGLAILLVTVGIRLILYPLFVTQIRSQRAMQEVGPALAELKAKHGKDRQRMAEEQMKLYRERGVNPAMGCLPLLIQMPILFGFYAAMLQMTYGLGGGFGGQLAPLTGAQFETIRYPFIPNPLGPTDALDLTARWLPWLPAGLGNADPLYILPVLAGVTQLIASLMAQPAVQAKNLDPQAKMMQSMVYYFPIITVVIAIGLPSGLAVYWVATTVFQIVQQYFVTGWGQLTRWLPFLRAIPTPADKSLARGQREAIAEVEHDMAEADAEGEGEVDTNGTATREEGRRRGRRRRRR
jgi:YidC/Oxa1 family membrane protein insertase